MRGVDHLRFGVVDDQARRHDVYIPIRARASSMTCGVISA
jgi:hypothetical protein